MSRELPEGNLTAGRCSDCRFYSNYDDPFVSGVPLFLANGAIAAFIKFYNNTPPAILVAILHGLAVVYLLLAHARWFKHLFANPEREHLEVS